MSDKDNDYHLILTVLSVDILLIVFVILFGVGSRLERIAVALERAYPDMPILLSSAGTRGRGSAAYFALWRKTGCRGRIGRTGMYGKSLSASSFRAPPGCPQCGAVGEVRC